MPKISIRGTEMPASPIRKLAPLAEAAKQRGVHVFHLNIGQPDLPTPQVSIDAIRNIDRSILEYSPSAGYRSYREKLVGYYDKFNIKLTADDIIITSGGSEAVLFSFMACLNPGDEIIVPEPAYLCRSQDTHHCYHHRRGILVAKGGEVRRTYQRTHTCHLDL